MGSVWCVCFTATDEYNSKPEVVAGVLPPYRYAIIVCAMRKFLADFSLYYKVIRSGQGGEERPALEQ